MIGLLAPKQRAPTLCQVWTSYVTVAMLEKLYQGGGPFPWKNAEKTWHHVKTVNKVILQISANINAT